MKLHVETVECAGHGQCFLVNPSLFPLDDDGFSAVTDDIDVPAELADDARRGVQSCPSQAISLH
jgi:ferredoxin